MSLDAFMDGDFLEAGFLGGWFPFSKTAQEAKKRGALLFCGAEKYNDMSPGKMNKYRAVFDGVSGMTRSERGGEPGGTVRRGPVRALRRRVGFVFI